MSRKTGRRSIITVILLLSGDWICKPCAFISIQIPLGESVRGRVSKVRAMNRYEKPILEIGEAEVQYLDGDYRVLRPGLFVTCAVTKQRIPIENLRYWSVDRQEAYAGPEAVMQRFLGAKT